LIFDFDTFSVDVDVEKTRKYYRESPRSLTEGCDCILCRNFLAAYHNLDAGISRFFDDLGVDLRKAPDMTSMHGDKERNILYYEGFCHLCGTILKGGTVQTPEYSVTPGCTVYFSTRTALVEKSFPAPALQIEVNIEIPWVMGGNFDDTLHWYEKR
jgi:hypothetical protein